MTEYPDLLSVWMVNSAEGTGTQGITQANPIGVSVEAGDVLAALDSKSDRHLLIPLLPGEAATDQADGSAVRLSRVKFRSRDYLSAFCTVRRLDTVFTQFARELLEVLRESESPAHDVTRAFHEWKALFAAASGPELNVSEQIGLLAELQLLERLVRAGNHQALSHWHGPDKSQHDFCADDTAIEVKASLAREGRRIGISSLQQLEAPNNDAGRLFLAYTRYERSSTGDSLPSMVDTILNLGVESALFERKLRRAGYFESHREAYLNSRFALKEQKLYDVKQEHFPRVTPRSFMQSELPPGVVSINYVIDVTNEPPTPLEQDETLELIEEFVDSDS
ncbi:MAG: PD-(D/E)XK motif protein [Arthrobacter sp.]